MPRALLLPWTVAELIAGGLHARRRHLARDGGKSLLTDRDSTRSHGGRTLFSVANTGSRADRLVALNTPVAKNRTP